jgi:hypothetical protein
VADQDIGKPYTEERYGNIITRRFRADVPIGDLIWHRDEHNRKIKVVRGKGWQFQFDNELPQDLQEGEIVLVPREIYHRLLRGYTDLILEITETR